MTSPTVVPAGSGRMRSYVLWSFFVLFAASPFFAAIVIFSVDADPSISWWGWAHVLLISAEALLAIIYGRRLLNHALDGGPLARWVLPTLVILGAAAAFAGALVERIPLEAGSLFQHLLPVLLPLLLVLWALALVTFERPYYLMAVAVVGVIIIYQGLSVYPLLLRDPQRWATAVFAAGASSLFVVALSVWSCQWTLSVTRAVDTHAKIDAVKADLAAAEERLRIARDLHDVFGRTLTAVAVKSELAAALADAEGAERAAEESRRVRALADDALREVRSVLAEYRRPELPAELAGAHSLLAAAGVQVRIIGEAEALPARCAEGLALVVREAATNIVRHSEATLASFRLTRDGQGVSLTVRNNGVPVGESTREGASGSGLESLTDRISSLGGTLRWERQGDTFTLIAWMETSEGSERLGEEVDTPTRFVTSLRDTTHEL